MSPVDAVAATLVMFAGCAVQGAVGFGANLVAAPLLVLLDAHVRPWPHHRRDRAPQRAGDPTRGPGQDRPHRATPRSSARSAGVLGAGLLLAVVSDETLSLLFALLVLLAVALSMAGWHLAKTRPNLLGVGAALRVHGHGVRHRWPARSRSCTSAPTGRRCGARWPGSSPWGTSSPSPRSSWPVGSAATSSRSSQSLLPGALAGYAASGWLAGHLDRRTARPIILGLSTAAALAVLVRTLF